MNCSKEIVVVGSCMIDFVCFTPRLPKEGETIHGYKFMTTFGGKGANQCTAAALLGGNTAMVARVGDDLWADKYIDQLKEMKVDASFIKKTPNFSSGVAQIVVSDLGQNQIVIIAGANTQLSVSDVQEVKTLICNAEVVVCQLETPVEVAIETLCLSSKISILNGAPGLREYDPKLLQLPTYFCVNETEAEEFTGLKVESIDDAKIASEKLLEKGCNNVIITLGAQGAVYTTKDGNHHHVPSPVVKAVDSTGAGDAFIGALSYLLAKRKDLDVVELIKIACFVAADCVTRPGTQISFPGPDIIDKYFQSK